MNILEVIAQQNKNVRVISFSRNFGHEAAMIAGIDHAAGDVIICMDADLQHPLECIAPIMAKFFVVQFIVMALNYIFSKLFVFRSKE